MEKTKLKELYVLKRLSVAKIAKKFGFSESKVNYWMRKYDIQKRSISDAIYEYSNPKGDPFKQEPLDSADKVFLYGLGLGLYWGEGTKMNKYAIRLGNTDPEIIKLFIKFLVEIYSVDKNKLRYGLQLFNDSNIESSIDFWCYELNASREQFYKVIVSKVRGKGNYKNKSKNGVLTIYFHNIKLRNIINSAIDNLKKS